MSIHVLLSFFPKTILEDILHVILAFSKHNLGGDNVDVTITIEDPIDSPFAQD